MIADDLKRTRKLRDDERALWRDVTRSVVPLKRRRMSLQPDGIVGSDKKNMAVASTSAHAAPVRLARAPKGPPQLLPLDRRTRQRIARGAEPIDDRIDLHGRTQSQAHQALLRFLHRAQGDGARTVLVITGKGADDAANGRGVFKQQVPLWLGLPDFRIYVSGFEQAHVGHGGQGALYVRLRRAR